MWRISLFDRGQSAPRILSTPTEMPLVRFVPVSARGVTTKIVWSIDCELLTNKKGKVVSHYELSHTHTRSVIFLRLFSRQLPHNGGQQEGPIKNPSTEYGATKRPWSYPISLFVNTIIMNTGAPSNAIESYCTFTLAPDVTAGGLPSEEEIAKDLESTDDSVSPLENDPIFVERGLSSFEKCIFLFYSDVNFWFVFL